MDSVRDLPMVRAIRLADPLDAVDALAGLPGAFLLHSGLPDGRARWSFFGADPFASFAGGDWERAVTLWRRIASRRRGRADAPFTGGAVGYLAYDFGRRLEKLPSHAHDDLALPDFALGFYDVVGAFDHSTGTACLFATGLPAEGAEGLARARRRLDAFELRLAGRRAGPAPYPRCVTAPAQSTFGRSEYCRAVERIREHIRSGDIFQAHLSQRWTVPVEGRAPETLASALIERLSLLSPAPHAAFLALGNHAIASASPERFLELRGRRVETRPIKGTRPRGATPETDAALRSELEASAKDRAENVMIVDVLRNDLGRVCEAGSVRAERLCEVETFPQVFHLTSTVTGALRAGLDALDLMTACFPGGSITGAPKIRAMEILEDLEPVRRHIYTGSIGYLDWSGDADWSIAIRTALVTPRAIHYAAGGGITADSEPEAEYQETLDKAAGLEAAIGALRQAPAMANAR